MELSSSCMAMHHRLLLALDIEASYVNGVSSASAAVAKPNANDVISHYAVNGAVDGTISTIVDNAVCGAMVSAMVFDSMSLSSSSSIL